MTWLLRIPWGLWPDFSGRGRRGARRAARSPLAAAREAAWRRDPLAHPVLQQMSQRELGDLPFDPRRVPED